MITIAHIVGARPQFIKYYPLSKVIQSYNAGHHLVRDVLIHTGQHYDYRMSKVFFDELEMKAPEHHLGVGSGTQGAQTSQILAKVEDVLIAEKPDIVVVYGDTNSTLGGALAAAKLHIPVAHVEAGLRSFNKYMPEEINRIVADNVSRWLFCPSKTAVQNLRDEGFKNIEHAGALVSINYCMKNGGRAVFPDNNNPSVLNVGDIMYDVLLEITEIAQKRSDVLTRFGLERTEYFFATLHRAENTDEPQKMEELIGFINDHASEKAVIFPMHPRTCRVYENTKKKLSRNVRIVDPVSYFDNLVLLKNSSLVMTDSGGIQKEAFWLRIPCITLRDQTEWKETIASGWNVLYKNYFGKHAMRNSYKSCYGDGKTAQRIVNALFSCH